MARKRSKDHLKPKEFPDALKDARDKSGLTHEILKNKLDKSIGLFSMYETGMRFPPKTTFDAILKEIKPEFRANLKALWEKEKEARKAAKKAGQGHGKKTDQAKTPKDLIAEICTDLEFLLHKSDLRNELEVWIKKTRFKWKIEMAVHDIRDIQELPAGFGVGLREVPTKYEPAPAQRRKRRK
jgi:hypothetical protein